MRVIEIDNIALPELKVFSDLTESQLRNRKSPDAAVIIVESPKVIATALSNGYEPISMLCERKHIIGDAADILCSCPEDMPVYTADRDILSRLTGYKLTRGVLCAMRRPESPKFDEIISGATRICVLDGVSDTTNIGSIFRSGAALGIDAILLTKRTCDPFNRRSIRVSMGSVFLVPWCRIEDPIRDLEERGFRTVAMALRNESVDLEDPMLNEEARLAIIMGEEGWGLDDSTIDAADYTVKIPMSHGVDSLNVGAASAIAFYQLCKRGN